MEAKTGRSLWSHSCHFLAFLLFISSTQTAPADVPVTSTTTTTSKMFTSYIKTACSSTTYPKLCFKSLSSYASTVQSNPQKLCNAALSVALNAARNASTFVRTLSKMKGLSPTEVAIIKDCIENIGDGIDELRQSQQEMGQLGGNNDVKFQMANIKTWVSAAITDEDTCTDGFKGKRVSQSVKNQILSSIVKVARLTSNALALINGLK